MKKISFLIKRIRGIHYDQLFDTIGKIHAKTNKNRIILFFDIIYCGFKYQAGYTDYLNSAMYKLNREQRRDVVTSGINNQYIVKYNHRDYIHYFVNKVHFNETFAKYLGRDWMYVTGPADREAFSRFIQGKTDIMIKPVDGAFGSGIEKHPASMDTFDAHISRAPFLVEERIIQVDELASLNATSVNTIRAVTFLKDGKATLLHASLRIGKEGVVDNFCSGGMLTTVDLETGNLKYPAVDGKNLVHYIHPISKASIVGFRIPQWDAVKAMVLEAAKVVPQVQYVGWDVAVTEKGPCLIEGNEYPGHVFYVFAEHHPDGNGCRKRFESIMN